MKVTYDPKSDSANMLLRDEPIRESDEVRPGVIADFGHDGRIVRFEILHASRVFGGDSRGRVRHHNLARVPSPPFAGNTAHLSSSAITVKGTRLVERRPPTDELMACTTMMVGS